MERSAVYRRALAPIMLFAGCWARRRWRLGLVFHWIRRGLSAGFGWARRRWRLPAHFHCPATGDERPRAILVAAHPAGDPGFVAAFAGGMCLGVFPGLVRGMIIASVVDVDFILWLRLHAAGFFMPRGIKLFGWLYIAVACGLLFVFDVS